MGNIVCFDRADQRAHQNRIDSDDARIGFDQSVRDLLQFQVLAALNAGEGSLPLVQRGQCGRRDREIEQPLCNAVIECIDFQAVMQLQLKVLAESECPLVRALKVAIANCYVQNNATELADLRATE